MIFRSNSRNEGREIQTDTTFLDNEEIARSYKEVAKRYKIGKLILENFKMLSELQGIRRRTTMTTTTTTTTTMATISSRRKGYEKTSGCGGVRLPCTRYTRICEPVWSL
ncbi:hypothetical protein V1477_017993 [Vespula maculifrons]|uniref:Uncharacterized protein n=1 Tax=Vespula maculifrons TaxID=7453 RepID=A0ABD2AZY6_VESMC